MKNKIVIATLVSLLGFTACSDDSGQEPQPVRATAVRLEGAIGLSTRAVIGSGYNEDLKVCFARRDETGVSTDTYGGWGAYSAVRSGGAGSRPIIFNQTQVYPADGSRIHLHGYYPADSVGVVESNASTGKVTFTIDGKTDVMSTGRITASGGTSAAAEVPVACTFYHLLSQLSFVCYSNHLDKWGEITKIEAAGIPLKQELDWTVEAADVKLSSVANSETGTLQVQGIDYPLAVLQVGQDDPLPGEDKAKGYILLPVSDGLGASGKALWLNITTTKDGKGSETATTFRVPVSAEGGFQAGSRHVLFLFFTDGIGIEVSQVGVIPWIAQEEPEIPM